MLQIYKNLGWRTIPIPQRSKAPILTNWQIPNDYDDSLYENIGILLGECSNNLIDIDLDNKITLKYAPYFLPATAIFGRESNPKSHYLYYVKNAKPIKFTADKKLFIELRSNGQQTIFPPSIHPSGEVIEWHKGPENIISISFDDINKVISLLSTASLLHEYWVQGNRQNLALYLSGVLLQEIGLSEEVVQHFIYAIATETNDPEISERLKAVETTNSKIIIGEKIGSWGKLQEILNKSIVDILRKWLTFGKKKSTKKPADNFISLVNLLQNSEENNKLKYNSFTQKREYLGNPIEDIDIHRIRVKLYVDYGVEFSRNVVDEGLLYICENNSYDPLKDYLLALKWDGIDRIQSLLRVLDITPRKNKLYPIFITKFLLGAVNRALNPGCKFDTILILVGKQGYRKSTFFRKLCPREEWFSDQIQGISKPDDFSLLQGKWIIEFGELYAIAKSRQEMIKRYLSRQEDEYRRPYGHNVKIFPRRCVYGGTTNSFDFLDDETGDRRNWVIEINKPIDTDKLVEIREQLWAQFVYIYHTHNDYLLKTEDEIERHKLNQHFTSYDDIEEDVMKIINNKVGFRSLWIIHELGLKDDMITMKRVNKILVKYGYRQQPRHGVSGKRWYPENLRALLKCDPQGTIIRMDDQD